MGFQVLQVLIVYMAIKKMRAVGLEVFGRVCCGLRTSGKAFLPFKLHAEFDFI